MLKSPPNVGDVVFYGEYDPQNPPYYGYSTFIVESIDKGNYTLRLNSSVVSKRRVSLRYFIKKSREKRVETDANLAAHYSLAYEMLADELRTTAERYFEGTGVKL